MTKTSIETVRRRYAGEILRLAGVDNPRIEAAFASVPREAFLPGPPWRLARLGLLWGTTDVSDLYDDVLVVIDRARGINNGEPALHAAWLAAVDPQPGETAIHVGAGTGYYTAILATLVQPGGRVEAYEYETDLAEIARSNLGRFAQVVVHAESAIGRTLPEADVVYVNAGAMKPYAEWLKALLPGGRLIFPWQPAGGWGTTLLVTRIPGGFSALPSLSVAFIGCAGETSRRAHPHAPASSDVAKARSVWLTDERIPDASAVAVYDDVWVSSNPA